jgi:hypothetical protein
MRIVAMSIPTLGAARSIEDLQSSFLASLFPSYMMRRPVAPLAAHQILWTQVQTCNPDPHIAEKPSFVQNQ